MLPGMKLALAGRRNLSPNTMDRNNDFNCAMCAAEFSSSSDLVDHEQSEHSQQKMRSVAPGQQEQNEPRGDGPRQNRQFTRAPKE